MRHLKDVANDILQKSITTFFATNVLLPLVIGEPFLLAYDPLYNKYHEKFLILTD
jgi:hypothetical protein